MSRPRLVMGATVPATVRHFMVDQAIYFAGHGWDVHLICSSGPGFAELTEELAESPGVQLHAIAMSRNPSPLADIRALVQWVRLLRLLRPDIVVSGTPKGGLLGILAARITAVPVRVYLVRGLRLESQRGIAAGISWFAERVTSQASTAVVAVSHTVLKELRRRRIAPVWKSRVIGSGSSHGVDVNRFRVPSSLESESARQLFQVPHAALVIGYAGRLTPDKGVESLLAAMRLVVLQEPRAHLLAVGELDDASPLAKATVDALQTPWTNHVPRTDDMPEFYWALDVFCLPSLREGMPNVNLEAAASGLPVVTTTSTGCKDSVLPDVTGLVVPPGSIQPLAEALLRVLANESDRQLMGLAGRTWVVNHFQRELVWQEWLDYLWSSLND